VRRLAIFIRKSLLNGLQFAVFEPNDETLWLQIQLQVEDFMGNLFEQGAFAGADPNDAFFVKCDAETTTPEDQAAGFLNIVVGFAPVRPAEYIVVKLSQKVGEKA
jgi:hypothetical protein